MTTKKKIALLFHQDCDGFGAAFAAQYGLTACEKADEPELLTIPVQYGQEPPYEQLRAFQPNQVYILDFSYKAGVLASLMNEFDVVVLDHHKSAAEDLKGFTGIMDHGDGSQLGVLVDETRSGAVIAWQFFNPETPIPEILLYVQDRDLWKFDLEHSKEINAFIGTMEWSFDAWMDFYTPEAYDCGKAIIAFRDAQIKSRVKAARLIRVVEDDGYAIQRTPGVVDFTAADYDADKTWMVSKDASIAPSDAAQYVVPIVNASENISELGDALAAAFPDAPFSVSYCDREDGVRSYSLRSRNGFDVSVVAKAFGGGGHFAAADFTLPAPPIFHDDANDQYLASLNPVECEPPQSV